MTIVCGEKKDLSELFDIPMGSFHGAEICDLIGLHIMSKMSTILDIKEYGLYRDDGLAIIANDTKSNLERLCKKVRTVIKDADFRITIDIGHMNTDFLDINLNLRDDTYQPFKKPNSTVQYINAQSNHPWHIKKSLSTMINDRLTTLSKNDKAFQNCKLTYADALK